MPAEEIVVSATGGRKGSKLARFDLLPWDAIWKVAEVFGLGARKYADRNWEKGYAWGLSISSLGHHLALFAQGFDYDTVDGTKDGSLESPDGEQLTGALHIAQVAWHALVLTAFFLRRVGTDNRKGEV